MINRNIVVRPEVDLSVADRILKKYRDSEEKRKDDEGLLGVANHTQYTADYGDGIKTGYYVYQTKTNLVIGKNYLQNFSVKLGEEYDHTSDPIAN